MKKEHLKKDWSKSKVTGVDRLLCSTDYLRQIHNETLSLELVHKKYIFKGICGRLPEEIKTYMYGWHGYLAYVQIQ